MPGTDRVVINGAVAVLVSPGHGAGWSTWNEDSRDQMLFDPQIISIMLADEPRDQRLSKARTVAELKYPGAYLGGLDTIEVAFVPEGTRFILDEYDGNESIRLERELPWIQA